MAQPPKIQGFKGFRNNFTGLPWRYFWPGTKKSTMLWFLMEKPRRVPAYLVTGAADAERSGSLDVLTDPIGGGVQEEV